MKRLWRWIKSRAWFRSRKVITELLEQNDYLQQRTYELEEERKRFESKLLQKEEAINELAGQLKALIKEARDDLDSALELGERQERQIQALQERLKNEEEAVKAVVASSKVLHERWKSQVMIEGARQGSIQAQSEESFE